VLARRADCCILAAEFDAALIEAVLMDSLVMTGCWWNWVQFEEALVEAVLMDSLMMTGC